MATRPRTRRASLSVEQLEDRRLLSVTVVPSPMNLATVVRKTGSFSVVVLSNDDPGLVLLQAPSVTVQVSERVGGSVKVRTLGTPLSSNLSDLNRDGIPDLILAYSGTQLQGFVAGTATVDVTGNLPDGTSAESFVTVNLRGTGQQNGGHVKHHKPKHHHHTPKPMTGSSTPAMRHR
jgi:hypothetical protein